MKIYKFRSLGNEQEYNRLLNIIQSNKFRCSSFKDMNDAMEGFFLVQKEEIINSIFSEKMKYKICSFSGEEGFKNPALRGYYANGFKGVAIELNKNNEFIKKVQYIDNMNDYSNNAEKVLLTKLKAWKHEDEYRFIKKADENNIIIGDIKAIYFGDPYHNIQNKDFVINQDYINLKEKLINNIKELGKEIIIYNLYFDENSIIQIKEVI